MTRRSRTIELAHESRIFDGTRRSWWIHIPAGVDPGSPSGVMVFNDGEAYLDPGGWFRVPRVLDDLIPRGELPPMVAVFVNPGHRGSQPPARCFEADNRSFEYDTVSPTFAGFLESEILPGVARHAQITGDPSRRAICGFSSGGICAFSAAWHRPDLFRRVMSHAGSFAPIRGGDAYPSLIETTPAKPLLVYLQCGLRDLVHGNWGNWREHNLRMVKSLETAGYPFRFDSDEGAHDGRAAGTRLPESLRWLWSTSLTSPG